MRSLHVTMKILSTYPSILKTHFNYFARQFLVPMRYISRWNKILSKQIILKITCYINQFSFHQLLIQNPHIPLLLTAKTKWGHISHRYQSKIVTYQWYIKKQCNKPQTFLFNTFHTSEFKKSDLIFSVTSSFSPILAEKYTFMQIVQKTILDQWPIIVGENIFQSLIMSMAVPQLDCDQMSLTMSW